MRETTFQVDQTPRGFPYPDVSSLPQEVREKYESMPAKINLFRMLAHSHGLYVPLMDFTQAVFKNLELPKKLYEMIVLLTASRTGARYEWEQHLNTAPKAGVTEKQIRAIESNEIGDHNAFDERERLVLEMADEILTRTELAEQTLHNAMRLFPPGQIIEVLLVVGFYFALAGVARSVTLDYNPAAAAALAQGM